MHICEEWSRAFLQDEPLFYVTLLWLLLFVPPQHPSVDTAETPTWCCSSTGDGAAASSRSNWDSFSYSGFLCRFPPSVLGKQRPIKTMSFRWTRASWPAIAKVACALVFFHMCTQKWSPWACEDETEPDSWERIGNSWLHNLFSLSTKKFCLNGRRGIWSRFLDIQRYGTKESRNRLTPWRSVQLMHLGHAGTYYTWASYMQSTRATSPAPSDVLCGPWPPLCARNFQAVTVLPSPPRSNANFSHFSDARFLTPENVC